MRVDDQKFEPNVIGGSAELYKLKNIIESWS